MEKGKYAEGVGNQQKKPSKNLCLEKNSTYFFKYSHRFLRNFRENEILIIAFKNMKKKYLKKYKLYI